MKKILRFKKQLSFLMLLILLCGLIAPVSEIKAEERAYYFKGYLWSDSRIIIIDKENYQLKYGVMDYNGKVIVEPQYDEIELFSEGLASAKKDGKWGCIDKEGREVIPFKFNFGLLQKFDNGLSVASKDGKWVCIDKEGREVIPFKFKSLDWIEREFLIVVRSDGRYGYINKKGEEFYIKNSEKYDELYTNSDDLYTVKRNGKKGVINKKGKVIVPIKYDDVDHFHEGMAKVEQKELWNNKIWYSCGFVNKKGKEVIPVKYDSVSDFNEGLAAVEKDEKWGFVNKKGKVVIPFRYDDTKGFSEGLAAVEKDGKWGFVNKKGKVVIPFRYRRAENFSKGKAEVTVTEYVDQWGYEHMKKVINKKGDFLYYRPYVYRIMNNRDILDTSHMIINKEGKKIVLKDYFYVENFYEGRAYAQNKNGKFGYIDENGNPITDFEYDYVVDSDFRDGIAMVCKDGKYGFINREGKVVVPIIHGYIGR